LKLLNQDESSYTFLIGKRERDVLVTLLQRYPVISGAHFHKRHQPQSEEARNDRALLEEALSEQQKESKQQLKEWLSQPQRWSETDLGYNFQLSSAELEWLLQVLNDIRVGTWVHLGEPDVYRQLPDPITEEQMQLAWIMEVAGTFQHVLLSAASRATE
jgi:hypothetical protein